VMISVEIRPVNLNAKFPSFPDSVSESIVFIICW
jgi:hypothetical protein